MKLRTAAAVTPSGERTRRLVRTGALVAVMLAAGAAVPALASGALAPKIFYACVTTKTGTIRIVSGSAACATGQHKISWNNIGPRGPRGVVGPRGLRGARGPAGVVTGYQDYNSGVAVQYIAATTVATLHVPSGNYVVNAAVMLTNPPGTTDNVFCSLSDDTSDATGGDIAVQPGTGGAIPLTMTANGATTLTVICDDDQGAAKASATITAVPTTTNVQTTG